MLFLAGNDDNSICQPDSWLEMMITVIVNLTSLVFEK